ncbi:hypothetical protein BC936DRAFT_141305 [Jimgerdemannia flammicorona]|uniref:Uncharacterized protein n=1 Tax=Jimgerdemannia flammicorona TaxID=994334 RepID=A0A433DG76_9FUNG|nr:hypothetical protein BC936DRAFT_141305 [Jimgerdemannia flammicorona]
MGGRGLDERTWTGWWTAVGMVNFGVVNFGVVNFGVVNFGVVNFGVVNFGVVNFGVVNFGVVDCSENGEFRNGGLRLWAAVDCGGGMVNFGVVETWTPNVTPYSGKNNDDGLQNNADERRWTEKQGKSTTTDCRGQQNNAKRKNGDGVQNGEELPNGNNRSQNIHNR